MKTQIVSFWNYLFNNLSIFISLKISSGDIIFVGGSIIFSYSNNQGYKDIKQYFVLFMEMPYTDKQKMMSNRRKYYSEYYHKNKPEYFKLRSIKHETLLIQYQKIVNPKLILLIKWLTLTKSKMIWWKKLKLYYKQVSGI